MSAIAPDLIPGFVDPVHHAQAVFRCLLDALALPGRSIDLDNAYTGLTGLPDAASRSLAAALLTLADFETPVWFDAATPQALKSLLRFHCGAPVTDDPSRAAFAVIGDAANMPSLSSFSWGTADYPDRSATLLIVVEGPGVDRCGGGSPYALTGPGIPHDRIHGRRIMAPRGLTERFWQQRAAMQQDFPRGVDCLLFAGERVIGLPRTTIAQAHTV